MVGETTNIKERRGHRILKDTKGIEEGRSKRASRRDRKKMCQAFCDT